MPPSEALTLRILEVLGKTRAGDSTAVSALCEELAADGSAAASLWQQNLKQSAWLFANFPGEVAASEPDVLPVAEAGEVHLGYSHMAMLNERAAVLAFDDIALERWVKFHAGLAEPSLASWLGVAQVWLRLMRGETAGLEEELKALFVLVSAQGAGPLVIEVTALRALVALELGAVTEAHGFARRASLMATSEGLPYWVCLANLVLARFRRYADKPYAASRILTALSGVAPQALRPWLGWELLLAGGPEMASGMLQRLNGEAGSRSARAAISLNNALESASVGARAAFDAAVHAMLTFTSGFQPSHREACLLISLMDPAALPVAEAKPWLAGKISLPPAGLHGVCTTEEPSAGPFAIVIAGRARKPQRLLRRGLPLLGPDALTELSAFEPVIADTKRRGGRTRAAIAALSLAHNDGLPREDFFRVVHGFAFSAARHQGALDVLVHRVRQELGTHGEVVRLGNSLKLQLTADLLVVPDPRCSQPLSTAVLAVISRMGVISALAASKATSIPLRTVQAALQQLVSDGICRIERKGRGIAYVVADTAFSEMTPPPNS